MKYGIMFFLHMAKRLNVVSGGMFSAVEIRNCALDYECAFRCGESDVIKSLVEECEPYEDSVLNEYINSLKSRFCLEIVDVDGENRYDVDEEFDSIESAIDYALYYFMGDGVKADVYQSMEYIKDCAWNHIETVELF